MSINKENKLGKAQSKDHFDNLHFLITHRVHMAILPTRYVKHRLHIVFVVTP